MKGSYVLLIKLPEEQTITIGRRQAQHFPGGYYAYVGSAMSGFKPRISHHLKKDKKLHWHIDYLLQKASINGLILCPDDDRAECTIAQALSRQFDAISGFGASDCKCQSHLFLASDEMKPTIITTVYELGMNPKSTGTVLFLEEEQATSK